MSEREEIRWKFQVMLENINMVMDKAENERKVFDEQATRVLRNMERQRNYRLSGIGFFIGVGLTLVAAGQLVSDFLLLFGLVGLGGIGLFIATERMLNNESKFQEDINTFYYITMKSTFIPLKAMLSTYAMDEKITKEQIETIQNYVSTYGKAIDYTLTTEFYKKFVLDEEKSTQNNNSIKKFNIENYRFNYEAAKEHLNEFKNFKFSLGTNIIEDFIEKFEEKDKKKK